MNITLWCRAGAPPVTGNPTSEFLSRPCSFAIEDEEEALARAEDDSIPGSVVNITDILYGEVLRGRKISLLNSDY